MTSRNTAKKGKPADVAVLGPPGTFTDLALRKYEARQKKKFSRKFCPTIGGVFKAVEKGWARRGVVPLKNSLRGTVKETSAGLRKSNVVVQAQWRMKIRHALVAMPGMTKKMITAISSHPQALRQCGRYLQKKYPHCRRMESDSTMAALEKMVKKNDRKTAAIISLETARESGVRILAKNIGDSQKNFTTFIVIQKAGGEPA
jgi:prephenate dehydratase